MTTNEVPAADEAAATSPVESFTQPPPDVPPQVSIQWPMGTVTARIPTNVRVYVDRGTTYRLQPPNTWIAVPMVTLSELELTIPGVADVRDHRSSINDPSTDFRTTFPGPGTYSLSACGRTAGGTEYNAHGPLSLTVVETPPPPFTWTSPGDGSTVEVGPAGGQVTVTLATETNVVYPLTVDVTVDGATTSGQHTAAGTYSRTVNLANTPLGSRSITVRCSDAGGRSTTQTRTIVAHTAPTVTLDPYENPQILTSQDFHFILTGKTTGAGRTKVEWSANGTSGLAENTGPGGDWSSWRASIPFNSTGTFPFTVTVTDSQGATGSASNSLTLQLPPSGGPLDSPPAGTGSP